MTAFLIRPDMPGFKVVGTVHKLGIRGSTQAELSYDGLVVPADHLLGAVGRGFGVAVHVLNAGRLTLAAGCTGATKRTLKHMTTYGEHRVQFGHPLADFEITQRKLSRIASEIYASDCDARRSSRRSSIAVTSTFRSRPRAPRSSRARWCGGPRTTWCSSPVVAGT